ALPRAYGFELEEPRLHAAGERVVIGALASTHHLDGHRGQPPGKAIQVSDLAVECSPREVFEKVVVQMDPVERRVGGLGLVPPAQVVSRKVRKRFSRSHAQAQVAVSERVKARVGPTWPDPSMYNRMRAFADGAGATVRRRHAHREPRRR